MRKIIISFILFLLLIGVVPAYSQYYGPRAVLTETITAGYNTPGNAASGSLTSLTNVGYIYVYVPNTDDVLQYVRLNLSSSATTNTNIRNWNGSLTAYRDYAMSNPALSTPTKMYMNTTAGNQLDQYATNLSFAPSLNISMSVTNTRAGDDLYSENDIKSATNILRFNFTIKNPSSNKNIVGTNITYNITFNTTGSGFNSSVCVLSSTISQTAGTASPRLRGSGCTYDAIEWQGTLNAGAQVSIIFNATSLGGNNYLGTENNLNDDSIGANASYFNNTHVISEITFTGRFARGPVREGIDLMKGTPWRVKSYIKNMGNESVSANEFNLTYNISAWRIYNVTASTGAILSEIASNNNLNYVLGADREYKIPDWINTLDTKPYIAPYFDWYVIWNSTNTYTYSGSIISTMALPTLYEIDDNPTKVIDGTFAPEVYSDTQKLVSYNVTALHTGNSNSQVKVGKLQIYSVIPNKDVGGGGYANMTIKNYEVYYKNTTGVYNLTIDTNVKVTVSQSTTSSNGTIILDLADLSSADRYGAAGNVGLNMTQGESIVLHYELWAYENSTGSLTSGIDNNEVFFFGGNQTLYTQSGTYLVVNNTDTQTASQNSLSAYKELISYNPSTPQLVNVTIQLNITGTIDNIKLIDYIPTGMSNYTKVFMSSTTLSAVYNRTKLGTITTSDGISMDAWEITNATAVTGWNITNGDLRFTYQLNLSTPGLYILPVQIAAFDPGVDSGISLTRYGSIKYTLPEKTLALVIDEDGNLQLFQSVIVGKPASWRESFNIYNPNSKPVKSQFKTEVFKDTVESYASYYDDYGKKIEESVDTDIIDNKKYIFWETTLNPQESRSYEIRVLTPPVVEVDRDIEILEKLEDKHVKLKADIVIKNFAEEPYSNLKLNLNIPKDNIFELKDAFGNPLTYTGDGSSTTVTISRLDANNVMTITITYKQSYPTVIITPDRTRYDSGEIANLEILIINGGEKIENPSLETEIYTEDMDMVYADIIRLEKALKPLEKTELSTKFLVPVNAPTGKYIANVRFSEDMTAITESSINFYVLGIKGDESSSIKVLILVLLGAVLIYFAYKRLIRVSNK
ncbi:MAG: hypothetical protein ABIG84_07475 [archaeon]